MRTRAMTKAAKAMTCRHRLASKRMAASSGEFWTASAGKIVHYKGLTPGSKTSGTAAAHQEKRGSRKRKNESPKRDYGAFSSSCFRSFVICLLLLLRRLGQFRL